MSHLRRIILRFDFIMNSYLRNFVRQSINDWVSFIKSFTLPKYEKGELWTRSATPLLVISLSYKKPEGKKPRRRPIDETLTPEEQEAERAARALEDEKFMHRLEFNPSP
jgi:hypothetical protein